MLQTPDHLKERFKTKGKQKELYPIDAATGNFYDFYGRMFFKEKQEGKAVFTIDKKSPFYVTRTVYSNILSDFFGEISSLLRSGLFVYKMPHGLGELLLAKKKPALRMKKDGSIDISSVPVDYQATLKLWEENPEAKAAKIVVRHLNKHTEGYKAFMYYAKSGRTFTNHNAYFFRSSRTNSRLIGNMLLANPHTIHNCYEFIPNSRRQKLIKKFQNDV